MREVIPEQLWIGNALDARDISKVLALGANIIVDLAIEEPPIQFPRDIVYCRFPLIDGVGNSLVVLRAAIETTANFIASQTPVVVACGAGMSRAPSVIAAAMAVTNRAPFADTLQQITAGQPHDVSPSLLKEVGEVYRLLLG